MPRERTSDRLLERLRDDGIVSGRRENDGTDTNRDGGRLRASLRKKRRRDVGMSCGSWSGESIVVESSGVDGTRTLPDLGFTDCSDGGRHYSDGGRR